MGKIGFEIVISATVFSPVWPNFATGQYARALVKRCKMVVHMEGRGWINRLFGSVNKPTSFTNERRLLSERKSNGMEIFTAVKGLE